MSNALTDAELSRHLEALNSAVGADTSAARAWLEKQLHRSTLTPPQRIRVQEALTDFIRAHGEEAPSPVPPDTRYF